MCKDPEIEKIWVVLESKIMAKASSLYFTQSSKKAPGGLAAESDRSCFLCFNNHSAVWRMAHRKTGVVWGGQLETAAEMQGEMVQVAEEVAGDAEEQR